MGNLLLAKKKCPGLLQSKAEKATFEIFFAGEEATLMEARFSEDESVTVVCE
ncbi:hypothetical protein BGZ65_005502, partial [Modicella reniformis]